MTTTAITTAIQGQTEQLAAIYAAAYRGAYARTEQWKVQFPGHSPFDNRWAAGDARMAQRVTGYVNCMPGTEHLDEAEVAKVATRDAEALAANYAAKVEAKAAGMADVTVSAMDASGAFVVTGTKAGRAVEIRQSIVTKTSPKGNWFHQFPALVYIDGKKSTEKALKAL